MMTVSCSLKPRCDKCCASHCGSCLSQRCRSSCCCMSVSPNTSTRLPQEARLDELIPGLITQAGTTDSRALVGQAKMQVQGVLRVQLQDRHRPPQALQATAQRRRQGASRPTPPLTDTSTTTCARQAGMTVGWGCSAGKARRRGGIFEELQRRRHRLIMTGKILCKTFVVLAHSPSSLVTAPPAGHGRT